MRRILFCGLFGILLLNLIYAQDTKFLVLSLKDCEKLAFEKNQSIQNAKFKLKASKAKWSQASHAKYLPKFQLKNVWGPIPRARGIIDPKTGFVTSPDTSTRIPQDLRFFTQLDIDLVQPIFTFGKFSNLNEAAYQGVLADQANVQKTEENIRLKVRRLYWGLVLGKELLNVVEDADTELQKAETKVEEKLEEGSEDVTQIDLFKLQLFRYEINKRKREAKDNIQLTKAAMRITLGLTEDVDFDVATEYLDPIPIQIDSLPFYIELAKKYRPELEQLRAGISARRALVSATRSDYYPQFFLGGQIKFNYAKDRFDPKNPFLYNPTNYFRPGIVIGLNWNLNFVQTRDKIRVAQAEYLALSNREMELLKGIELEVQKAYLELKRAMKNMQDSRKALKASENWLRSATMTFDIGVGEVKDLIDAFRANGTMQTEHLRNIFEYNVAVAKLSQAIGKDLYPEIKQE
ncbi:MAG: TolC family protein [Calditrichaeota bacterium]|nr:MAG: TolC family protein [Calditrichota bacterium]